MTPLPCFRVSSRHLNGQQQTESRLLVATTPYPNLAQGLEFFPARVELL